jgi:hypothetical protein
MNLPREGFARYVLPRKDTIDAIARALIVTQGTVSDHTFTDINESPFAQNKVDEVWGKGTSMDDVQDCLNSHRPVIMRSPCVDGQIILTSDSITQVSTLHPDQDDITNYYSKVSRPSIDDSVNFESQRDSEHCVQDEQHTASTGSSEEASDKDTTLPQFVRTDLDEFLDAYETFIHHKQNSEEGWGLSAKLTNVLDRISLTEGDKYDPLRIQLNSEGYREIEKHIKSVLTTANGMEIKVNKWLKEYQSGDIEMS